MPKTERPQDVQQLYRQFLHDAGLIASGLAFGSMFTLASLSIRYEELGIWRVVSAIAVAAMAVVRFWRYMRGHRTPRL